jgi:hypothetical protein
MNRRTIILSLLLFYSTLLFLTRDSLGWGSRAHPEIHRHAVRVLPADMKAFFERHADTLAARSVEPDLHRRADSLEAYYHYIDIDRYGAYPFRELPRSYAEAVKKFGKATVDTNGTLPWRIAEFTGRLSDAMKRKDETEILYYATYLGHYVSDAHVPLHTVENYDGQLTNQKGLHARWESRIPEMFGENFRYDVGAPYRMEDPLASAFGIVLESHLLADSVLALDMEAREGIPEQELMKMVERRGRMELQMSEKYYARYYKLLNGMVERQLAASARRVASYWYTAWVDAGKPDL